MRVAVTVGKNASARAFGGAECPKAEPLSPCQACPFTKCSNAANGCFGDAECLALVACAKPCNGDQTCVESCEAAHPSGVAGAQALGFCAKSNCPAVCQ